GEFEVDWGKNNLFEMHGSLFQPGDVRAVPHRYGSGDDNGTSHIEMREGAMRPLGSIVGRLELMGYTLEGARRAYERVVAGIGCDEPPIAFDALAEALRKLDVDEAAADYHSDYDFGEFFAHEIFDRLKLKARRSDGSDARYELGEIME